MVAGGASAYLYERPEESRTSRIPSGGAVTIPEFGTGALGYRSAISGSFAPGQPDALFGTTGYLLVSVERRQAQPGHERRAGQRAPDPARAEQSRSTRSTGRCCGAARRRCSRVSAAARSRAIAGARSRPPATVPTRPAPTPTAEFPPALCLPVRLLERDRTGIHVHLLRTGNRQLRRAGPQLDEPAQAAAGLRRPRDPRPELGHPVRVQRGHDDGHDLRRRPVLLDPGDRPGRQRRAAVRHRAAQREPLRKAAAARLRPRRLAAALARAGPGADRPPPPPAPPAPAAARRQAGRQAAGRAAAADPAARSSCRSRAAVPAVPPPPAAAFARPIPPGGATVRVFEEKSEEEEAPEQSQAFARYWPGGYGLPLGVLILLAAAGASIGRDRRADPAPNGAGATFLH